MTPASKTVLLLDFNWYVFPLSGNRILLWRENGREIEAMATPQIEFLILNLDDLMPLANAQAAAEDMRAMKQKIVFEGGSPIRYSCPTTLEEGVHPITSPPAFLELPELLVLADFGSEPGNQYDKMFRSIFAFDFKARRVSVIPQHWFNEGKYDFGYQWITRVQRERKTGQIVGEGIRLGNFRLDQSAKQIQEWLHKDVFYHPEREI